MFTMSTHNMSAKLVHNSQFELGFLYTGGLPSPLIVSVFFWGHMLSHAISQLMITSHLIFIFIKNFESSLITYMNLLKFKNLPTLVLNVQGDCCSDYVQISTPPSPQLPVSVSLLRKRILHISPHSTSIPLRPMEYFQKSLIALFILLIVQTLLI